MRTNTSGFALTVGMALMVILLGFGALSAAGLVGFSASEALAEQNILTDEGCATSATDSTAILSAMAANPTIPGDATAIANGDVLFKANCTQCHAVNEKVVGPALAGITKRRSISWIVPWVHNPAKVIASGDDYAVKLYNEYDKQQMPSFVLSKKEIEDIVAWIGSQQAAAVINDSGLMTKQ